MPIANFIVAGATRSGTTSLWQYLRQHPDIFLPENKELWFFNVDERYSKGKMEYNKNFKGWSGQIAIGDVTPMYFTTGLLYEKNRKNAYFSDDDSAVKRMAKMIPDAKIILTLRNPVTRLISQHRKNLLQGKKNVIPDLAAHIERDIRGESPPSVNFVIANKYSRHLEHVFNYYRREQIFMMIFEEWTKSPEKIMPELFKFLGIRQNIDMGSLKSLNTIDRYNNKSFLKKYIMGIRKGNDLNTQTITHPLITAPVEENLVKLFADDVAMVEQTLSRKIIAWDFQS